MRTTKLFTGAFLSFALMATPALAQTVNPTQEGYTQPAGVVQTQVDEGTPPPPAPKQVERSDSNPAPAAAQETKASGDKLPFTGLELGLVLAAGLMLTGIGLGMRRAVRPSAL